MEIDQASWAPGLWITDNGEPEPANNWSLESDHPWAPDFWACGGSTTEVTDSSTGWCGTWPQSYALDCVEQQEIDGGEDGWSEAAAAAGLLVDEGDLALWGADSSWPDLWLCDGGDEVFLDEQWKTWLDPTLVGDVDGEGWTAEQWEAFGHGGWNAARRNGKRAFGASGNLIPRSRSHSFVPRRVDFQTQYKQHRESGQEVTTMMIRNVPNRYSRHNLMEELDDAGFEDKYDFVYIPVDNATKWNVGYAFVNFEDPSDCSRCMVVFDGREFKREARQRPNCETRRRRSAQVALAHLQGLQANLEHIMGKSIFFTSNSNMRPWAKPSAIAKLPPNLHMALTGEMAPNPFADINEDEILKVGEDDDIHTIDCKQLNLAEKDTTENGKIEDNHRALHVNGSPVERCIVTSVVEADPMPPAIGNEPSPEKIVGQEQKPFELRCHGRGRPIVSSDFCGISVSLAAWGSRRPKLFADGRRWPERPCTTVQRREVPLPTTYCSSTPNEECIVSEATDDDDEAFDSTLVHGTGFSAYSGEAGVKAFSEAWSAAVAKMKPPNQANSRQRNAPPKVASERRDSRAMDSDLVCEQKRCHSRDCRADDDFNVKDPREAAAFLARRRAPSMPAPHTKPLHTSRNGRSAEGPDLSTASASSSRANARGAVTSDRDTTLHAVPRRRRQSQPPRRRGQMPRVQSLQDPDWNVNYGLPQDIACDDETSCNADVPSNLQATWESSESPLESSKAAQQEWPSCVVAMSAIPLSENDIRLCYMCPENSTSRFAPVRWPISCPWKEADDSFSSRADARFTGTTETNGQPEADWENDAQVTSIVVQNLPSDFGQETLLAELRFLGLSGSFDFLYLPMDAATSINIGSAFLNFRSPEDAEHARSVLEGHAWQHCSHGPEEESTRAKATVDTAVIQGLVDNVMHYCLQTASAQNTDHNAAPLVFPSPGIVLSASWDLLDPNSECAMVHWDSNNGVRDHCVTSEELSLFNPWVEMHASSGAPGLIPLPVGHLNTSTLEILDPHQGAFDLLLNCPKYDMPSECSNFKEVAAHDGGDWNAPGHWGVEVGSNGAVEQDEVEFPPTEIRDISKDCTVTVALATPSVTSSSANRRKPPPRTNKEKHTRSDSSPETPPLGLEWPTLSQKPTLARRSGPVDHGPQPKRRAGTAKSAAARAPKGQRK